MSHERIIAALTVAFAACGACAGAARAPVARSTDEIAALVRAAAAGDVVRVPEGVYTGRLRVDKAVTLDGGGRVVIDGGGEGTVVELLAEGITFRGFTVRGSGSVVHAEPAAIRAEAGRMVIEDNVVKDALFGIDLRMAADSFIRRNRVSGKGLEPERRGDGIRLWWSRNCTIEDNHVQDSRDMVFWYSEELVVRGNRVSGSRYGLHFMYSHDTVLTENVLSGNSVGVYLMYSNRIMVDGNVLMRNRGASGYGLGLKDCDDIIVRGNAMLANRVGSYIDNSPSSVDSSGLVEGNMIAFNEIGVLATPNTHDNVLTGNAFVENEEQVAVHGRGNLSQNVFAREGAGNFWSDYSGFDLDGDGVGDLPYEARSLFETLIAREPNLRMFIYSPAQQAVDFTARALPEVRPEAKFVDPFPLTRAPAVGVMAESGGGGRLAMGGLSALLLAGSCGVVWSVCRDGGGRGTGEKGRVMR